MASRLITRDEAQTAPGYVSPAPVAAPVPVSVAEALPQQSVMAYPVGLEVPTVLLANHAIESELLGVTPRHATLKPDYALYIIGVIGFANLCSAAQGLYSIIQRRPDKAWILIFPVLFLSAAGVLVWQVNRRPNQTRDTLRYGVPRSAFVELIDALSGGGSHTVTYWYADAAGQWVCGTVDVPSATVALLGIAPGYVFTLLVSPHGEGKPLPYFMASQYRVAPVVATAVSHNVSVRVAALEAERLAATAKQTGTFGTIEPELLQAAPRSDAFFAFIHNGVRWRGIAKSSTRTVRWKRICTFVYRP